MPSAASAAASSIDAPPAIASSAARRPKRRRAHVRERDRRSPSEPLSRSTTAATPTVAQSWARRLIFMYDQPAEPSFGTRISTSISSGASAVWKTPVKNSPPAIARSPPGRATTSSRVEREDHGGEIRGRIAVGERPSDRAAMPHLRIADLAGRVRHDRAVLLEQRRAGDVLVPRERTDRDRGRRPRGRRTARRAARCRRGSAGRAMRSFIAGRSECPPASSFASSSLAEQLDRVLDALGDLVVERCGNHDLTSSIARHTLSGVAGIWMSVTPRCESASTTALMTAGAAAIVPVSPTPFTPSGLSARVSVRSVS